MRMMQDWLQMYFQDSKAMYEGTTLLQKVNNVFAVAGPHFVKHLMILAQDPTMKAQYQQLNAQWAEIANYGDMIKHNADREMQAQMQEQQEAQMLQQQYEQQQTPDQIKARGAVAVKDMKMRADIERDKQRDSMKFALDMARLRDQDAVNRAKAAIELANQARQEQLARIQDAQSKMRQGEANDKNKR